MTYLEMDLPPTPRDRLDRVRDDPDVVARPGEIVELFCPWEGSGVPAGDCYLVAGRLLEWARLLGWDEWRRQPGVTMTTSRLQPVAGPLHSFATARVEVPGATKSLCGWIHVESPGIVTVDGGGFVVGRYEQMPDWPIRRCHSYWCEPFLYWDGT